MKKIIYSLGLCLAVSQVSAQVVSSTALFVGEDAVVSFGMDVVNNGELTNNGKVHFRKNVENTGKITSEGVVVFDGYTQQEINGSKAIAFKDVQLNNDVRLNTPMTVENELSFRRGVIQTMGTNALVFAENASHNGASDFSHVAGNVQKVNASKFEFPVGDGTNYRGFEANDANKSTLTAEYFAKSTTEITQNIAQGVETINENEYWVLRSNSNNADVKVNLVPTVYDYDQIAYLKKGTWQVSDDNRLSGAMGLRNGITFTSGRGSIIKKDIGVWPNPTQGEFNLNLTGLNPDSDVVVDVVNQDGRTIMHLKGVVRNLRNVYQLPQNLPTTELTLRVVDGEDVLTQKLVLNR